MIIFDVACLLIGLIAGSYAVARIPWIGWLAGVICMSGSLLLCIESRYWIDPKRDAGVFDAAVIMLGTQLAIAWCSVIWCLRFYLRRRRQRRLLRAGM